MTRRIYLVEYDNKLSLLLKEYLENEGYKVTTFANGICAKNRINDMPDLWILNIMLPDINGYELIKFIKRTDENTPVIFISSTNEEFDRVMGLELGSDDYISKPFLPRELVIRTNRLMYRIYGDKNTAENVRIKIGEYLISKRQRRVFLRNQETQLTNKEFDLLCYLAENKDNLISREQILTSVWGNDYFGSDRVVDDTIRRLRKKVNELTIETVYGYGYRLVSGQ